MRSSALLAITLSLLAAPTVAAGPFADAPLAAHEASCHDDETHAYELTQDPDADRAHMLQYDGVSRGCSSRDHVGTGAGVASVDAGEERTNGTEGSTTREGEYRYSTGDGTTTLDAHNSTSTRSATYARAGAMDAIAIDASDHCRDEEARDLHSVQTDADGSQTIENTHTQRSDHGCGKTIGIASGDHALELTVRDGCTTKDVQTLDGHGDEIQPPTHESVCGTRLLASADGEPVATVPLLP